MGLGLGETPGIGSIRQVDGDSDMAPVCLLWGGGLRKGTMASASISVWEKAAPDARQFSSTAHVGAPVLELRVNEVTRGTPKRNCLGY